MVPGRCSLLFMLCAATCWAGMFDSLKDAAASVGQAASNGIAAVQESIESSNITGKIQAATESAASAVLEEGQNIQARVQANGMASVIGSVAKEAANSVQDAASSVKDSMDAAGVTQQLEMAGSAVKEAAGSAANLVRDQMDAAGVTAQLQQMAAASSDMAAKHSAQARDAIQRQMETAGISQLDLSEVSGRLSAGLVSKYNATLDTVARTRQMAAQAQQAAEVAAVTIATIKDQGMRGYAESLLAPVLAQIQDGSFYSEPSCERLGPAELRAFQSPLLSGRVEGLSDEELSEEDLGFGTACQAKIHFEGMPAFRLVVTLTYVKCSPGLGVRVEAAGYSANFTVAIPGAASNAVSIASAPDLCSPVGMVTPLGMIKPCVQVRNMTVSPTGLASSLSMAVEVPMAGKFGIPYNQVVTVGSISKCTLLSDCGKCGAEPGCGWCQSSQSCLDGTPRGDACQLCSPCSWFFEACPSKASCTQRPRLPCGWCSAEAESDPSVAACMLGDEQGPYQGICNDLWVLGN